jgi:hypothetical protein
MPLGKRGRKKMPSHLLIGPSHYKWSSRQGRSACVDKKMSANRMRPTDERGTESTKNTRVADQRQGEALQFVLQYAPPDTDWEEIVEVYSEGLRPPGGLER